MYLLSGSDLLGSEPNLCRQPLAVHKRVHPPPCRFTPVSELKPSSTEMVVSLAEHAAGVWAEPGHPGWYVTHFDSHEAASGNLVPVSNASHFADGPSIFTPPAPAAEEQAMAARSPATASRRRALRSLRTPEGEAERSPRTPLTPSKRFAPGSSSAGAVESPQKQARGSAAPSPARQTPADRASLPELPLSSQARGSETPRQAPPKRASPAELRSYSQVLLATTQQLQTEQPVALPTPGGLAPRPPSPVQAVMLPIGMLPPRLAGHFPGPHPPPPLPQTQQPQPPMPQPQQQQEQQQQNRREQRQQGQQRHSDHTPRLSG
jgi:hypothetical protein